MKSTNPASANSTLSTDPYDFSGPLWKQYHTQTRKKVRFPRGYKEVSLLIAGS